MINMVKIENIDVVDRIRKGGPKPAKVLEMLDSIRGKTGLISPGQAAFRDGRWRLTVGETRLRALEKHWAESTASIKFGTTTIPWGCMPLLDIDSVDPAVWLKAEIDENVIRTDLTWQEKAEALASLYAMEPEGTPVVATARRLSNATGQNEDTIRKAITRSLIVSDNLGDPEVAKATTEREAWNIIKRKTVSDARREERDTRPEASAAEIHTLLHGKCEDHMAAMPDGIFDLLLGDPPYGVGADEWSFKRVEHRHRYKDDFTSAMETYRFIAREGYRVTKDRANLFFFCSAELWHFVADIVELEGWIVWPRPVVWIKGNEGMRPWGQMGFGYGHEAILFATKAETGLIQTSMDVLNYPKPRDRMHAAQKPDALYARLMELTCVPGAQVLDPTCGSGTVFRAATLQGLRATGIEQDEEMAAIASHYTTGALDTPDPRGADNDLDFPLDLSGL